MAAAAVFRNRKIAISLQLFDWSPRNSARWHSLPLLSFLIVKISKSLKIEGRAEREMLASACIRSMLGLSYY